MKNVNLSEEDINTIVDLVVRKLKNDTTAPKKEQKKPKYSPAQLKLLKDAWVKKTYDEYRQTGDSWTFGYRDDATYVMCLRSKHHKFGMARCNRTDTYDVHTGIAIAYARAQKREIPDFMFM